MANNVEMLSSYRHLVTTVMPSNQDLALRQLRPIDAIFVPARGDGSQLRDFLPQLNWYEGPVYVMPSEPKQRLGDGARTKPRVLQLTVSHSGFTTVFRSLATYKSRYTHPFGSTWDLPVKRNCALWWAARKGYDRILLVDDDIRGLTRETLVVGSCCLDSYAVAGCYVQQFPDTSVVGHLDLLVGIDVSPFLSGSFLFIKTNDSCGLFPHIYNEDWLFMVDHISDGSICSFGSMKQMSYDPFCDPARASFQEFGEIIAEGLYSLLSAKKYALRYDLEVWRDIIYERREELNVLRTRISESKYQEVLRAALQANSAIGPEDCLTFIADWELDLGTWKRFLEEAKSEYLVESRDG